MFSQGGVWDIGALLEFENVTLDARFKWRSLSGDAIIMHNNNYAVFGSSELFLAS
jgi:hypothetical protein